MSTYLWKVTAIKDNGSLKKGFSVEILKKDTNAKPSQKEISSAINQKYNTNINDSLCGLSNFEIINVK